MVPHYLQTEALCDDVMLLVIRFLAIWDVKEVCVLCWANIYLTNSNNKSVQWLPAISNSIAFYLFASFIHD